MRNIISTAFLSVFILISFSGSCQAPEGDTSVVVNSLEGEPATIHIKPDYISKNLIIQLSPSEVDSFPYFSGVKKIEILDKFISVSYIFREEDKTTYIQTELLCVSKGHLYDVMSFMSYEEYHETDSLHPQEEVYHLTKVDISDLQSDRNGGYQLTETEYEKNVYPHDSSKNYGNLDTYKLSFDPKDKEFNIVSKNGVFEGTDTSFMINSLEGKPVKIDMNINVVNSKMVFLLSPCATAKARPNDSAGRAKGDTQSEMICCNDVTEIEKIKVFGPFISVQYDVRCGSDCGEGQTVIVFVSNGKLCKALDIESLQTDVGEGAYNGTDDSLGLYYGEDTFNVNFLYMQKLKNGGYELTATQYEKVKFQRDTDVNHENLDTLKFTFDKEDGIFYTRYFPLQGSYVLEGSVSKMQKVFTGKKYPEIEIKGHYGSDFADEYFFIDGYWYDKDRFNKNCLDGPLDICN